MTKIVKYSIMVMKIAFIGIFFPLIGDYVVNEILKLGIEWAYSVFLVLGALLAIDVIHSASSSANTWGRTKKIRNKIEGIIFLVIFLVIAYFPVSQGINIWWVNILFFGAALLLIILFWWFEQRRES